MSSTPVFMKIFMIFIMSLLVEADVDVNNYVTPNLSSIVTNDPVGNVSIYSVANQTEAIETAWQNYLDGNHNETDLYYDFESNYVIENITFPTNGTIEKRFNAHNAPLGTFFHQWKVVDQGTWDQSWRPASGCQYNGLNSGKSQFIQTWSQETSWSVDAGFNFNVGKAGALSIGISVTKDYKQEGSREVEIPAGSVGQTWTQKRMVWQNMRKQKCVRRHYGKHGLHCDKWGHNIHGNMPVKGPYNLGVSIGYNHVKC